MKFSAAKAKIPTLKNSLLAIVSAILLILSFPDFDFWFLAWFALVPLFFAVEREKQSIVKSFVLGWIFGTSFFFGSCWWLTYAPITYGGVPTVIAYLLFLGVALVAGFFPAIFAALFSFFLKRFGSYAILSAPFLWTATEFLRFNLTGNNWNAYGYAQAFIHGSIINLASIGGVYLVGFYFLFWNATVFFSIKEVIANKKNPLRFWIFVGLFQIFFYFISNVSEPNISSQKTSVVIAIQPNVPMNGLKYGEWENLRARHIELAENALQKRNEQRMNDERQSTTVIFPESPMNFEYESDRELKAFLRDFAVKNNASVLFNSAQPNTRGTNFFNSAVMLNPQGEKVAQYDKIHLVPFGETVPLPDILAQFVPTMVGNFETGANYNLFPFGDAKGGVMICFESHFPSLSREFVREGADVLIEMTNDGYLGKTPILRQHLANAVFRAVETNRPVLRVTNVGITAYINERGEVLDAAESYTQDTKVWTISKSDGAQTFYVKYGDWFAWLCSIVSLALLFFSFWKPKTNGKNYTENCSS
ncbi:MAG: apolipoprotein N-acyltransferase [Acidobacteriota bacterium]|nr:apolipoprotein N-acyltransferase [Acidobacteriota bacterium]